MIFKGTAAWICNLSSRISLASRLGEQGLQVYILAWLVVLVALLLVTPRSGLLAVLVAVVAFYRLQDLLLGSLDDMLGLTDQAKKYHSYTPGLAVLIALINIVEVILVFTIGYLTLAGDPSNAFSPSTGLSSRFDYLYLSWTTLVPPGSGYTPVTWSARALVILESASGLLIIVMALSSFLSRSGDVKLERERSRGRAPVASTPPPSPEP